MRLFDEQNLFKMPDYEVTNEKDNIKEIYYTNELYQNRPTKVFAYLGIPKNATGLVPGIVCAHGGGGKAFKEWVELWMSRGYAAIAMDLGGKNANDEFFEYSGPDQTHEEKFNNNYKWQDMWSYHAIAAVVRAHTILLAQKEVDSTKTGLTGISWGGYLTCCVAGLDSRFKFAIPIYGCGFLQENSAVDWLESFSKMTKERKEWWHNHCDPSIYLVNAQMPMMFITGTNDFAYPLDSLLKSSNLPQGKVDYCIRQEMPHGHVEGWTPPESERFANDIVNQTELLPKLSKVVFENNIATVKYYSQTSIEAFLLWSDDTGVWQNRKWHNKKIDSTTNNHISIEIPQTTSCFIIAVTDKNDFYISSEPVIITGS